MKCHSQCKTCKLDDDLCESCPDGLVLRGHTCEKECDQDEYFDINERRCKNCHQDCGKCLNSRDNCLSCSDEIMYDYQSSTHKCSLTCASGYYLNLEMDDVSNYLNNMYNYFLEKSTTVNFEFSKKCDKCSENCKECLYYSYNCISCKEGYYLQGSYCVLDCEKEFFKDVAPYTNYKICSKCASFCDRCSDEFTCLECDSRFSKIGNDCYYNNQTVR